MKEGGGSFLNEKYPDLQHSPEVEGAVKRQEVRTGEKAKDKGEKVNAYLDRLEEVFNPDNPDKKERRVDILKDKLHKLFVIKPEEIPESYFNHQKRIAREQGHGDIEITDEMREQMAETISHDQAQSLDAWIDYLGSSDATYPNWLKYFAFRSITKLSEYDKEKKEFKKRSKGTTAPFPDINREALAYVLDSLEKSHKKPFGTAQGVEAREGATDEQWEKLLKTANFGKLYAHAIKKITPASEEEKEQIHGEWVKYDQGSDAEPLCESLQGHGTGWCTAGEGVAKAQLELGDFYVFYSHATTRSSEEVKKVPRVAIRMQDGEIAEVRGINADQNLEPVMTDITKDKVEELPGAEKYEKKISDMKRLTKIEKKFIDIKAIEKKLKKFRNGEIKYDYLTTHEGLEMLRAKLEQGRLNNRKVQLTKEELRFLYEIDSFIEGFSYQKDPRIEELLSFGDLKYDYAVIFDCEPECVVEDCRDLKDDTVVLAGNLLGNLIDSIPRSLRYVTGYADLEDTKITDLNNLQEIVGNAHLRYSDILNLGKLQVIGGDVSFGNSLLKNLGDLQIIRGQADFRNSKIESLGRLKEIGLSADFHGSIIKDLGELKKVGRNVYIDEGSELNFDSIEVVGKITTDPMI